MNLYDEQFFFFVLILKDRSVQIGNCFIYLLFLQKKFQEILEHAQNKKFK